MSQPDYFKIACDITRNYREVLMGQPAAEQRGAGSQPTPGPWKHNGLPEPYFTQNRDPKEWEPCSVWADDVPICTTDFSVGRYKAVDLRTRAANARLIAAAPALLAALDTVLSEGMLGSHNAHWDDAQGNAGRTCPACIANRKIAEQARAALALARGAQPEDQL